MNARRPERGYIFVALVGAVILASRFIPFFVGHIWGPTATANLDRFMSMPYLRLGQFPITAIFLFKAVVFVVVLLFASRFIQRMMQFRILPRTSMESGQQYALARVASYAVFLTGLMVGLQSSGVNLNSVLVVGGTLGIGLGFGLQNIANNFVSGLVLLAEQPIRVGDRVEVDGTAGDVVRIGGRSTWVRTNDNVVIIVPNSEFVSSRVTNWTLNNVEVRLGVPIGVSYNSDPEQVRKILLDVARQHPDVLPTPAPDVLFTGVSSSALKFELQVWSAKQIHTPSVLRSDLYFALLRAFREHGIEFAATG
jgi:small-conductance mechanosensitive channel